MGQRLFGRRFSGESTPSVSGALRILVAESDTRFLPLHAGYLETEGCEVESVTSGAAALERIAAFQPHVIVAESRLVDMSAEHFLHRMTRRGYLLPVVLVLSGPERPSVSTFVEKGIYDYVVKESHPVYLKTLSRAVFAAYRSHQVELENRHLLDVVQRQTLDLERLRRKLATFSLADPESGFYDEGTFLQFLNKLIHQTERSLRPLTVLQVGLDCLDQIQDTFGDAFAAGTLRDVGRHMARVFRASDTLAHLPEGRYAALLPDTPPENAVYLVERLRGTISEMSFFDGVTSQRVTISAGVCSFPDPAIRSAEAMLETSGRLLAEAQKAGGNRIQSAQTIVERNREMPLANRLRSLAVDVLDGTDELVAYRRRAAATLVERIGEASASPVRSDRVVELCTGIARALDLDPVLVERVRLAGMLYDVGMAAVPRDLVDRAGPLDESDWSVVRQHPDWSVEIVRPLIFLTDELPIIRHHHERYDGTGYPFRLKGSSIPLGARILAVADAFVAMTESRPYRPERSRDEALDEIRGLSGTWFDPHVTEALVATAG